MVMIIFLREEKMSATKENDYRKEEPGQHYAMETKRVLSKGRWLISSIKYCREIKEKEKILAIWKSLVISKKTASEK